MYSLKSLKDEKKRAKGMFTHVRQKTKHEDYVDCLKNQLTSFEVQIRIAQVAHNLYTLSESKNCFSPFADKR